MTPPLLKAGTSTSPRRIRRVDLPPDRVFDRISSVVAASVSDEYKFSREVEALSRLLSRQPRCSVDYSERAVSFLYRYYAGNFSKCSFVARKMGLPSRADIDILDLGTGSGAGIAGFVNGLFQQDGVRAVRVQGIEENEDQIDLFRRVTGPYFREARAVPVESSIECRSVETLSVSDFEDADVVLDSFTLTELSTQSILTLIDCIDRTDATFVSVEQPDSGVLDRIEDFDWSAHDVESRSGDFTLPSTGIRDIGPTEAPVYTSGTLAYAVCRPSY